MNQEYEKHDKIAKEIEKHFLDKKANWDDCAIC